MTDRRQFLSASAALALSACATAPRGNVATTEVPPPTWRAGQSWTYRRSDAYNGLDRGAITRAVDSVGEKGIRVVTRHANGATVEDALFESPGIQLSGRLSEDGYVVGTFDPPLIRYAFPLASGKRWEQRMHRTDSNQSRYYLAAWTAVEGWEDVQVNDRTSRAIIVRRTMLLGPTPPEDLELHREELDWYVPELGSCARSRIREWTVTMLGTEPGYRLNLQLDSFKSA